MLGGVNYASAAAGILDETGQHYVRTSYVLYEHYLTLYIIISVYFIYMLMFNNLLNELSSWKWKLWHRENGIAWASKYWTLRAPWISWDRWWVEPTWPNTWLSPLQFWCLGAMTTSTTTSCLPSILPATSTLLLPSPTFSLIAILDKFWYYIHYANQFTILTTIELEINDT